MLRIFLFPVFHLARADCVTVGPLISLIVPELEGEDEDDDGGEAGGHEGGVVPNQLPHHLRQGRLHHVLILFFLTR